MESEPVDILVSARPGDPLAGRWPLRLRTMGVTVAEHGALADCRALLLCLSPADATADERLDVLREARAMRVPTVVVLAGPVSLSPEEQPLLAGVPVIAAHRVSQVESWRQILQALHAQQAILSDPEEQSAPLDASNQFRHIPESRTEWRMAALATLVVALVCLGWWVFLKRDQQERLRDQLGHPLLPAQPTPAPKAIPITPPPAAATVNEAPATTTGVPTARAEQALAFVQACVLASNRDEGFPPGRIDEIIGFFSDPTLIVGKGAQTHAALRASLTVREAEWPKWHDNIAFIKVDETPLSSETTVVVLVRSSFFAENPARKDSTNGAVATRYTVVFDAVGKPLISQVEATPLQ